ncbi:MAG: hypothetical protein A2X36_16520 [Elusimicrobia bacterium GWA2_69_24]|nr:MAG: hypothetical protein A2X36_16520 [Elusimicrobia bacterium GWA2_69_24]
MVEDDASIVRIATLALKKAGIATVSEGTGKKGIERFVSDRPDLVLLDVGLPDQTGFQVCRDLRKKGGETVPILFLTSHGGLEDRIQGFRSGGQDYIQKPFWTEELVARVRTHLRLRHEAEVLLRRSEELRLRQRAADDLRDMIVHDLKVPLTAIRGTISILGGMGTIPSGDLRHLIDNSDRAAEHMLLMINDILDMGCAEHGSLKTAFESVSVAETFSRVERLFEAHISRRGVAFRTDISPEDLKFRTDRMLLFRITANLVDNALKHSGHGAEVLLEASRGPGSLRLAVSDRGPGIPDSEKERIFDKYTRLTDKDQQSGRVGGIGLAFCRMAVGVLGGKIRAEDREGGGNRFVVELPGAL